MNVHARPPAPNARGAFTRNRIQLCSQKQRRKSVRPKFICVATTTQRKWDGLAKHFAVLATTAVLLAGQPASADIQTIAADEVVSSARPLKVNQPVNKGKIWLLVVLGASSLFAATVILENNETFFPAISRANKAMKMSNQSPTTTVEETFVDTYAEDPKEQERLQAAVLEGLTAASASRRNQNEPREHEAAALEPIWGSEALSSDEEQGNQERSEQSLFEISAEQIEASSREMKESQLQTLSVEQLQEELARRRAGAPGDMKGDS